MKILLIGNGFDLEHGLPTKYLDFLKFIREFQTMYKEFGNDLIKANNIEDAYFKTIFSDKDNVIVEALAKLTFENFWIKYFQIICQLHLKDKENWIDFESEISDIIQTLDYAMKFYNNDSFSQLPQDLKNKLKWVMGEKEILEKNNIKKCTIKLLEDLNKLICALEIYIWDYIDFTRFSGSNITYYNPDINEIYPDAVLSFNYSDTYRRVYAYNRRHIKYDFIHGKAQYHLSRPFNLDYLLEKCNLVLGIDEYLPDNQKSKEIDFIAFKKYFQRIHKQTGNQYKKWLEQIDRNAKEERKEENTLYIFGHSLDETDGDILRDLINHDGMKTIIFYKNKKILGQLITNLVKLLESDKVIEKVYGNTPSIQFVQQRERERIEGSSFEIVSDIAKLGQIYKLHSNAAQDILNKVNQKIKKQSLEYFCSQREVISLYDVLQRIGFPNQYKKPLLQIAQKLIKRTGLKQAEEYKYKDWEYIKYNNSIGCDRYTMGFIDSVNKYNKGNFVQEEEYFETVYEEFEEIKELVSKKKEIDKKRFIEIINHIFYMFHDESVNIEELWKVLLQVAIGPADKIAKKTLEELIENSDNQLDIVRYHHLLFEIETIEYRASR